MSAQDRLRRYREQQQQQQGGNPYGSPPAAQQRRQNPYDQRDEGQNQYGGQNGGSYNDNSYSQPQYNQGNYNQGNSYELQQVGNGGGYGNQYGSLPANDMDTFYNEIEAIQNEIRTFNANVDQISRLHSSLLSNVEPGNSRSNQQLENLMEETRGMGSEIKNRIKALQMQPVDEKAANMRKPQIDLVRERFKNAIEKYQGEEKLYRDKYKERMARQFKIVNPNATDAEVQEVVNGDQDVQIFAQAAMGNRYADSQRAYREVQQRHEEIKRIERTLIELAQLFNDMSLLVEQQNDQVNVIHQNAENAAGDIEAGKVATDKAVVSARGYRKKRWICLLLTLIILIIVGVAVGVEVSKNVNNNNKSN
ncbi:t-SNARE [Fomitiporia mediterranea MF3/22]|uniref:t-SNARE n=1 Tax=Fomitiporia mediterranea (strain MF3/22) TaxID=694068 RepID=UPI000440778D|nr:t-SNARE [Fomitiporia mediterranea MF3/22]EJD05834.1 t-SNARE [Fomitiporia mediterranea MF3/22]